MSARALPAALTIAAVHTLARTYLTLFHRARTRNLAPFLSVLRTRPRTHGLLTVSNHISVLDDPLLFSLLPLSALLPPSPHLPDPARTFRHALAAADICFRTPLHARFFALGQAHAVYRLRHDPRGGIWQPVLEEMRDVLDAGGWVHVFPEGRVHQRKDEGMRYFKWGVARLVLETRVAPEVVPVFLRGLGGVRPLGGGWGWGREVEVVFGEAVGGGAWEAERERWRGVRERDGVEARALRREVARRVRGLVEEVRRGCGLPEEEEGAGEAESYREEGAGVKG